MLEQLQAEVRKDISSIHQQIKKVRSSKSRGASKGLSTRNAKSFLSMSSNRKPKPIDECNYGRTLQDYRTAQTKKEKVVTPRGEVTTDYKQCSTPTNRMSLSKEAKSKRRQRRDRSDRKNSSAKRNPKRQSMNRTYDSNPSAALTSLSRNEKQFKRDQYGREHSPVKKHQVPQEQFCKLHLMKAIRTSTNRTFRDLYALRPTLKMTTPVIQAFVRCLSFVDPDYPSERRPWKECIEVLKAKGDKVLTDLMILPSKVVQNKVDLFALRKVGTDCHQKALPHISSLSEFQREIREIVKIQIHLFTFVEEKIKAEGL